MGLYSFVLFAAIVLLACVGSASKVTAANSTAQGRGDAEEQNGASTKSFARTSEPTDEGDEARGLMGKASVSHMSDPIRVRFWAMLGRPDKSIRVRLMSQMRKLYEKLATTDTNHFGHSNAEGAVKAYLDGREGAQLAKIASQLRNKNLEMHKTWVNEAVKRLDLAPEKDGALMRTLASFRRSSNEEMKTLATELLAERIRLLAGGEKPFDELFALIKSEKSTSRIFADEEWYILSVFHGIYNQDKICVTLPDIFLKYFGDEATLLKALAEAKKSTMSSKNAQEFEKQFLEKWANTGVELKVVLQWLELGESKDVFKKLFLLKEALEWYRKGQSSIRSSGASTNAADDFNANSVFALAIAKWRHKLEDKQLDQLLEFVFLWWSSKPSTAQDVENLLRKDISSDNDAVKFLVSKYSSFYDTHVHAQVDEVTPTHT